MDPQRDSFRHRIPLVAKVGAGVLAAAASLVGILLGLGVIGGSSSNSPDRPAQYQVVAEPLILKFVNTTRRLNACRQLGLAGATKPSELTMASMTLSGTVGPLQDQLLKDEQRELSQFDSEGDIQPVTAALTKTFRAYRESTTENASWLSKLAQGESTSGAGDAATNAGEAAQAARKEFRVVYTQLLAGDRLHPSDFVLKWGMLGGARCI